MSGPERDFLKAARLLLIGVVTWFLVTITGELIGNGAYNTSLGRWVGQWALLVALCLLPVGVIVGTVLLWRERRRVIPARPEPRPPLARPSPPVWRSPNPLHGRASEVDDAVTSLLANGVVVIAGPRDIGTSAVARTVGQRVLDECGAGLEQGTWFDLRSRSSGRPDDGRAAAGRILSSFGLDEPADATPALLADAGARLIAEARKRYEILLLDNVSTPDEVEWLVSQWPSDGQPYLVVAGESAIGSLAEPSTVLVGEMTLPALRGMWEAQLGPAAGEHGAELDALLRACFGRPRALQAFAKEVLRPGSTVTIESLLAAVNSTGPVEGPLERVWTAILDHIRDGLTPDAVWLLHALAELPVTALTRDAVTALRRPAGGADPLEELRIRNLVREIDNRYRLPTEVRRAVTGTTRDPGGTHRLAAVPALIRFHAKESEHWAARLGTDPDAANWFHDDERSLRPLFDRAGYHRQVIGLVIDDLAVIAGALETWYVREQQSGGLLTVNEHLRELADWANRPDLVGLATIRMATAHRMAGRFGDAARMLDSTADYPATPELLARKHIERALLCLARPDGAGLASAERELRLVLETKGSHPAMVTMLINLGAVCLHRGRTADALTCLRRAQRLATDQHDTGSRAHALELQGIASPTLLAAVPLWRRAKELFVLVGEEQGEARCLQHLGSAALADPRVAGEIHDGRPAALTQQEAAAVALPLLTRAKQLRAGQPDTTLVDHYLAMATDRLTP